jgi:hypothetical protein
MFLLLGRGRGGRYMYLRVALLAAALIAAFVLHASGETLVIMRIARWVLLAALIVGAGALSRRREQRARRPTDGAAVEPPASERS